MSAPFSTGGIGRPPLLALLLLLALLAMALVVIVAQGEEDRNKAAAETTAPVAGRRKATGGPIFPVLCIDGRRKRGGEVNKKSKTSWPSIQFVAWWTSVAVPFPRARAHNPHASSYYKASHPRSFAPIRQSSWLASWRTAIKQRTWPPATQQHTVTHPPSCDGF